MSQERQVIRTQDPTQTQAEKMVVNQSCRREFNLALVCRIQHYLRLRKDGLVTQIEPRRVVLNDNL